MPGIHNDAASRLWWGMRAYRWVVLPPVAGALVLGMILPGRGPLSNTGNYRASALVVAQQLQIRPEQLPRFAEAVFAGGSVAEKVLMSGIDIAEGELIPDHVMLEPITDTIALRVVGTSEDRAGAATLANLTANAFVEELNKAGPGVGLFAIQDQARIPDATRSGPTPVPLIVGLLAGITFGVGAVGALLVFRRPVLGPDDVTEVTGAVLITSLHVKDRRAPDHRRIGGLATLVGQMYPVNRDFSALVAPGRSRKVRATVTMLVCQLLGAHGFRVRLQCSGRDGASPLYEWAARMAHVEVCELEHDLTALEPGVLTLVTASTEEYDLPQLVPEHGATILLVLQGTPVTRIDATIAELPAGWLKGVVLLEGRSWTRRRVGRRGSRGSDASLPKPLRREAASPPPVAAPAREPEPVASEPALPEPAVPEPAVPEPAVPEPAQPDPVGPDPLAPVLGVPLFEVHHTGPPEPPARATEEPEPENPEPENPEPGERGRREPEAAPDFLREEPVAPPRDGGMIVSPRNEQ